MVQVWNTGKDTGGKKHGWDARLTHLSLLRCQDSSDAARYGDADTASKLGARFSNLNRKPKAGDVLGKEYTPLLICPPWLSQRAGWLV